MARLTRSIAVMTAVDNPAEVMMNGSARFASVDDDTELITRALVLDRNDWESFGCPDKITVTIIPGDALNPED